jgi:hypothetical protein
MRDLPEQQTRRPSCLATSVALQGSLASAALREASLVVEEEEEEDSVVVGLDRFLCLVVDQALEVWVAVDRQDLVWAVTVAAALAVEVVAFTREPL